MRRKWTKNLPLFAVYLLPSVLLGIYFYGIQTFEEQTASVLILDQDFFEAPLFQELMIAPWSFNRWRTG